MSTMSVIAHAWKIVQKDAPVIHMTVIIRQLFLPLLQPLLRLPPRVHGQILQVFPLQVTPLQVQLRTKRQRVPQQLVRLRQLNLKQLLLPWRYLASVMIFYKMRIL